MDGERNPLTTRADRRRSQCPRCPSRGFVYRASVVNGKTILHYRCLACESEWTNEPPDAPPLITAE